MKPLRTHNRERVARAPYHHVVTVSYVACVAFTSMQHTGRTLQLILHRRVPMQSCVIGLRKLPEARVRLTGTDTCHRDAQLLAESSWVSDSLVWQGPAMTDSGSNRSKA